MPVYLFTWHAYGTWMPDRTRGYVRDKTILPPNPDEAKRYRDRMTHDAVSFTAEHQQVAIETLRRASKALQVEVVGVATDATHLHVLVQWRDDRAWEPIRKSMKKALTISLKERFGRRPWLSENGSRKRVKDVEHYTYLRDGYLPSHRGLQWHASGEA